MNFHEKSSPPQHGIQLSKEPSLALDPTEPEPLGWWALQPADRSPPAGIAPSCVRFCATICPTTQGKKTDPILPGGNPAQPGPAQHSTATATGEPSDCGHLPRSRAPASVACRAVKAPALLAACLIVPSADSARSIGRSHHPPPLQEDEENLPRGACQSRSFLCEPLLFKCCNTMCLRR